mgnify:FL=1
MAKVLISFLGTGGVINKKQEESPSTDREPREYRKANYTINGESIGEYSFVSLALREKYQAKKVLMIGTVRSMWEEVYKSLKQMKDKDYQAINDNIYFDIAEHCEKGNYSSELTLPHQKEIEKELGEDSHIALIKYGLNEQELQENINIILSLDEYIKNGDELIIDITHSFRSLPIMVMQLLIYLKTISSKKINISHIFYGMLDITKEMGHTPIVDLTSILNINDWIIGAYAFQNYGNGSIISGLMENENKSVASLIEDFSKAMSLNHIQAIKKQVQRLSSIKNTAYSNKIPEMIIPPSIKEFIDTFDKIEKNSLFELKLAEWQSRHHNYAAAYISLIEAIITFVCENNGLDYTNPESRKAAKSIIFDKKKPEYSTIKITFNKLNNNRKKVAHSLESTSSIIKMINELNDGIKFFKGIIK